MPPSTCVSLIEKHEAQSKNNLTVGQLDKIGFGTIEVVRIPTISISIRILPNCLIRPTSRDSSRRTTISRQHKRTGSVERSTIASTGRPPIVGRINHGIPTRLAVVCVHEVADPGDHGGVAEPVAGRPGRVVLNVEHARKCSAVGTPSASMFKKEFGLDRARAGAWVSEVVSTTDQLGVGCADVMAREAWIDKARAFRRLERKC